MSLTLILIFSAASIILGLVRHKRWGLWILMGSSVVAIYWLQSATPIRHLDFWFPTASLALTTLVWAATHTQNENNSRRSLASVTIIAAILVTTIIIAIGLTRYLGPICCLTPSRPPDILKIAAVIALVGALSWMIVKLFPKSKQPVNLLIVLILLLFLVLKTDTGAKTISVWLRSMTGQSMDLAAKSDLPWLGFSFLAFRPLHVLREFQTRKLPSYSLHEFVIYAIFFPAYTAGPIDRVRAPYMLMQAVTRYRGTLTWQPNFSYNFCAQKIRDRDLVDVDLSSWRAVINCYEPMYNTSHQLFKDRFQPYGLNPYALATCYAMAENVFAVTQGGIDRPVTIDEINLRTFQDKHIALPSSGDEETLSILSAGIPIANTQLRVIDKMYNDLPARHIGEIALHSECFLSEYYHRPDITKDSFHDDWYLTGDLGYLANGELFITGHKNDLIIVGGKNIYPQDLEQLANKVPGVYPGRVAAFGVFNELSGTEDVVLVAEIDDQYKAEQDQIANHIRQIVTQGSDVALRYVHLVERGWLIKTSSGKVARQTNREKYYGCNMGRQAGSKS